MERDKDMKKKKGTFAKSFFITLACVLVGLTVWHQLSSMSEKKDYLGTFEANYVDIDGKKLSYEIFGEGNERTIVFLPAAGEFAPSISYRKFLNEMSKDNKIIVLEPFGYGLSDETDKPRTVENVVSELHGAVDQLGIEKYYLMAHSWGGVDALLWANEYTDEVQGFIGIDPSVPGMEELKMAHIRVVDIESVGKGFGKAVDFIGFARLMQIFSGTGLDESLFSSEEIEKYRFLSRNKAYTSNITDEVFGAKRSLKSLSGKKFPEAVPVLNLVSSNNCESLPEWKTIHEAVGNNNPGSKLVVVEGDHYLTNSNPDAVLKEIRGWLK